MQSDKKYLEIGVTVALCIEQPPRPLYLACSQILSIGARKPSTFSRHFHSKQGRVEGFAGRGDGPRHPKSTIKKLKCCN